MSDFLENVEEAFRLMIDRGQLAVESSAFDAQAFGNAVVVLAGEKLKIRVIRDRDDIFADVASLMEPDNWYPLQRAIRAAGESSPPPEGLLSPGDAARLADRYFQILNTGLAADEWNRTKSKLAEFEQEAFATMMNRVKSPP